MGNTNTTQKFNRMRQDSVIKIPDAYEIHNDFLKHIPKDELGIAFKQIWNIYVAVYEDIITSDKFLTGNDYFTFTFLYLLLISGTVENRILTASIPAFQKLNESEHTKNVRLKNLHIYIETLCGHGFEIEGLKENKIPKSVTSIEVNYPDNPDVIVVLKLMADKAYKFNRKIDFFSCHYRLFTDDMNTVNYGWGVDNLTDRLHTDEEKEFAFALDDVLKAKGYFASIKGGYANYNYYSQPGRGGYAYYDKKRDGNERIISFLDGDPRPMERFIRPIASTVFAHQKCGKLP